MRRPATIVDWITEQTLDPLDLSEPTKTWVDRIWHAVLDKSMSRDDAYDLFDRFGIYLDRVNDREADTAEGFLVGLMLIAARDDWPRCAACEMPICPHCMPCSNPDHKEPPAA
jgi:hypothetical protein